MRQGLASKREHLQSDVHYYYHCFNWVVGPEQWEVHCQDHIQNLNSKRCGTITHCHTLVRPGYCPFCLGKSASAAARRPGPWSRDHSLWQHIDQHLQGLVWPLSCPHPLCDVIMEHTQHLRYHFMDDHGLSCTLPNSATSLDGPSVTAETRPGPKRKGSDENIIMWPDSEQFLQKPAQKTARRDLSTITPSSLLMAERGPREFRSPINRTVSQYITGVYETLTPSSSECYGISEG